ncbi:lytic transglycosylase domain-containing protein [uncultured Pseudacidovorax sp.]|uniref:lytic transglycosylase domain-containing protein n=1 Tax=uncultured Pseudacidovorax sp. TaxID=679313 RepID=UPI0025E13729|nr:lytic transglycosylase domain-containing protein [uncultured Pseudacidovorax sp.]
MATIVDQLLVTLGLDVTGYKRSAKEVKTTSEEMRKALAEQDKKAKEQTRVLVEGYRAVRTEMLGLIGLALGATGVKAFFEGQVTRQTELARSARDLGLSARELDVFAKAARTVGGSDQGIRQSMQSILSGFEAFNLGDMSNSVVSLFRDLGVSITGADRKVRPMRDLLLDLSDKIVKLPAQRQLTVKRLLGWDDGTLNLMRMGRTALGNLLDEMDRASGVTDKSTVAAERADKAWSNLKSQLQGIGEEVFAGLAPAMETTNDWMLKLSKSARDYGPEIKLYFEGIGAAAKLAGDGISWVVRKGSEWLSWLSNLGGGAGEDTGNTRRERGRELVGELWARLLAYGGNDEAREALAAHGVPGYARQGGGAGRGSVNPPSAVPAAVSADQAKLMSDLERTHGLSNGLMGRVLAIESSNGKHLVSPKGALGPFQFMPATAKEYGLTPEDAMSFEKSAPAAARYLGYLLKRYNGDETMALAAYNWGMGNLEKYGLQNMPAQTRDYLRKNRELAAASPSLSANFQASQAASAAGRGAASNTTSVETNINAVYVQTQATNADDMARDMRGAFERHPLLIPAGQGGVR